LRDDKANPDGADVGRRIEPQAVRVNPGLRPSQAIPRRRSTRERAGFGP